MSQLPALFGVRQALTDDQVAEMQEDPRILVLTPAQFAAAKLEPERAGAQREVNGQHSTRFNLGTLLGEITAATTEQQVVVIADELDSSAIAALRARYLDDFVLARDFEELVGAVRAHDVG